ncbi:MAG TPA: ABC transporter permease [Gemmatimonadaceae bacterium]|nr:ABC transporter permease [Gemmatimonadaceae bacterium]
MSRLELAIAWRYLRSPRDSRLLSLVSAIAIGGVVIAVSALLVIVSVMNGLQRELRDRILIGSADVRVLTYGSDMTMTDWGAVLDSVAAQPGVVAAAPFVFTTGLIHTGRRTAVGVHVVGIEREGRGIADVTGIRQHADRGVFQFPSADGRGQGVVLGARLASRLRVGEGDTVRIISPAGSSLNAALGTVLPRLYTFEVSGTFDSGLFEYDQSYVYMPLERAQEFAALGSAVTGIEVRTSSREVAPEVAIGLYEVLGFPYRTIDWKEQNRTLFQALELQKQAMATILLLIVIVAAFNMVSTLTMVVANKTREIGILRAMGLPARSIRRIFLAQGAAIGIAGTGLGLALGILLSLLISESRIIRIDPEVYLIDHLPVALVPADMLLIMVASLAVAVVATLFPAGQAARMFPVEAIRHE